MRETMISLVGLAVAAFVSTNIDDLFLVSVWFADARLRPLHVVLGQLLGIGALVAASAVAALAALVVPEGWPALLGVVPLGLGLRELLIPSCDETDDARLPERARSPLLAIAAVTIANGGDNLGVYIPLFASGPGAIPVYAATFALMTGLWCGLGYLLVRNRWVGEAVRRGGHRLLPFALIGIGLYILFGARVLL